MRYVLTLGFLLISSVHSVAETSISGYLKSFAVGQDKISNPVFSVPTIYQSQNSLRLKFENFEGSTAWQLHYEISSLLQSRQLPSSGTTFNVVSDSYRLTDLDPDLSADNQKNKTYQNLDRLNYQWRFSHGDLTVGRQAISFGSARIINPTDVFLPFDVQTFNTEYRTGVDAIRYQHPLGDLGEVDLGVVLGKGAKAEHSAVFMQLRGNMDGKDLLFAYSRFSQQTMFGVGVQSALADFGTWFEAAIVTGDVDYTRMSLGLDYAFTENTFAMIEYHYNGAGSDTPAEYLGSRDSVPYTRGGVFLLGTQYVIPTFSVQFSPLLNGAIQAIYNISDHSAFLSASTEFNVAENFYVDFGAYFFIGKALTRQTSGVPLLLSEYGSNPNTVYASIRYYF